MFVAENESIGFVQYTYSDHYDMYNCWNDIDTQKGYNTVFAQSFDDFCKVDINLFKFWVVIIDKQSNNRVGVLRLGLDETCPDLAIWIYPQYRNKGYGTQSFALALRCLFEQYNYQELSAGCYKDNLHSLKILKKIGFIHYPEYDQNELNCFTNEETTQLGFIISRDDIRD